MNKSNIQKEYAEAVFLDYINKKNPEINDDYSLYFKEELRIVEGRTFAKKMIRSGYAAVQNGKVVLTKSGRGLLHDREDLIRFFNLGNVYVTLQDYAARKKLRPQKDFEMIMTELLREKAVEFTEQDNYEAVGRLHLDIATLYEQASFPLQALHHYLITLYFDVSGLEYYDLLLHYMEGKYKKDKVKAQYDGVYFRPEVLAGIRRLKDSYENDIVDWVYANNQININLCNKSRFVCLTNDIVQNSFSELEWQAVFRQNFEKILTVIENKRKTKEK